MKKKKKGQTQASLHQHYLGLLKKEWKRTVQKEKEKDEDSCINLKERGEKMIQHICIIMLKMAAMTMKTLKQTAMN